MNFNLKKTRKIKRNDELGRREDILCREIVWIKNCRVYVYKGILYLILTCLAEPGGIKKIQMG